MRRTKRSSVVLCAGLACATAVGAAVATAVPGVQRGHAAILETTSANGMVNPLTGGSPVSLQDDLSLRTRPLTASAREAPLQATVEAGVDEEAGASLGQILASWGLVAFIVLRRIVD